MPPSRFTFDLPPDAMSSVLPEDDIEHNRELGKKHKGRLSRQLA